MSQGRKTTWTEQRRNALALFVECAQLNPSIPADSPCWPNVFDAYLKHARTLMESHQADRFDADSTVRPDPPAALVASQNTP